jgi:hypothetical protein
MTLNRTWSIAVSRMLFGLMAAVLLVMSLSAFTVAPAKGTSSVKSTQAELTIPHVAITTIAGKYNYSPNKITRARFQSAQASRLT